MAWDPVLCGVTALDLETCWSPGSSHKPPPVSLGHKLGCFVGALVQGRMKLQQRHRGRCRPEAWQAAAPFPRWQLTQLSLWLWGSSWGSHSSPHGVAGA